MKIVYQSDLVDLKIIETESNSKPFYQVVLDGVVSKQSNNYKDCLDVVLKLEPVIVQKTIEDLKADVYYAGVNYLLDCEPQQQVRSSVILDKAYKALSDFESKLKGATI